MYILTFAPCEFKTEANGWAQKNKVLFSPLFGEKDMELACKFLPKWSLQKAMVGISANMCHQLACYTFSTVYRLFAHLYRSEFSIVSLTKKAGEYLCACRRQLSMCMESMKINSKSTSLKTVTWEDKIMVNAKVKQWQVKKGWRWEKETKFARWQK